MTEQTAEHQCRIYFLLVFILGSFLFFYGLGNRDVLTSNESEAAFVAGDILDTGRVLVPHLFDQPFVDNRPPASWWFVAASYQLTGSREEWAARLPSAIAALVCVLMVFMIGRRALNPTAGYLSALLLLGMLAFALQARMSQQDMLLSLWTLLSYWAFWRFLDAQPPALRFALAFHLFFGLAALTKGPAAVINVAIPLSVYLLYSRRWRDVKWRTFLLTSPLSIAMTFGWFVYVWVGWPSLQSTLILRFTSQAANHVQPWYFYFRSGFFDSLGVVTLFLPALVFGWFKLSRDEKRGPLGMFLIAALCMFLVYSLHPSKRIHYIVPLMPELAIALGMVIAHQKYHHGRYATAVALVLAVILPLIAAGWIYAAVFQMNLGIGVWDWLLLAVAIAIASLTWFFHFRGQTSLARNFFWCSFIVATALVLGEVQPRVDNLRSARTFSEKVAAVVPEGARLGSLSHHAALLYYTKRPIVPVNLPNANDFLKNTNDYLMAIDNDIYLIPEDQRQTVFALKPYRRRNTAYLLQGVGPGN